MTGEGDRFPLRSSRGEPLLIFLSGAAVAALVNGLFTLWQQRRVHNREQQVWIRERRKDAYVEVLRGFSATVTALNGLATEAMMKKIVEAVAPNPGQRQSSPTPSDDVHPKRDVHRESLAALDAFLDAHMMTMVVGSPEAFALGRRMGKFLDEMREKASSGGDIRSEEWGRFISPAAELRLEFANLARKELEVRDELIT